MMSIYNYSPKIFKRAKTSCLNSLKKKCNSTTMATLLVAIVAMSGSLFLFANQAKAYSGEQKQIAAVGFGLEKAAKQAEIFSEESLGTKIGSALKVAFNTLGVIFLLIVVISGIMWMTAAGNEETIRKSRQAIIASTIGFILAFSAGTITQYFAKTARNISLPSAEIPNAEPIRTRCIGNEDCASGEICISGECSPLQGQLFGACINLGDCSCSIVQAENCSQPNQYFIEGTASCTDTTVQDAIMNCIDQNNLYG